MLKPDLCHSSDAYIVVKDIVTVKVLILLTEEIKS